MQKHRQDENPVNRTELLTNENGKTIESIIDLILWDVSDYIGLSKDFSNPHFVPPSLRLSRLDTITKKLQKSSLVVKNIRVDLTVPRPPVETLPKKHFEDAVTNNNDSDSSTTTIHVTKLEKMLDLVNSTTHSTENNGSLPESITGFALVLHKKRLISIIPEILETEMFIIDFLLSLVDSLKSLLRESMHQIGIICGTYQFNHYDHCSISSKIIQNLRDTTDIIDNVSVMAIPNRYSQNEESRNIGSVDQRLLLLIFCYAIRTLSKDCSSPYLLSPLLILIFKNICLKELEKGNEYQKLSLPRLYARDCHNISSICMFREIDSSIGSISQFYHNTHHNTDQPTSSSDRIVLSRISVLEHLEVEHIEGIKSLFPLKYTEPSHLLEKGTELLSSINVSILDLIPPGEIGTYNVFKEILKLTSNVLKSSTKGIAYKFNIKRSISKSAPQTLEPLFPSDLISQESLDQTMISLLKSEYLTEKLIQESKPVEKPTTHNNTKNFLSRKTPKKSTDKRTKSS